MRFGSLARSILSVVQRAAMEQLIPTNAKTARFFEELRDYWYRHGLGGLSFSHFLERAFARYTDAEDFEMRAARAFDTQPAASAER